MRENKGQKTKIIGIIVVIIVAISGAAYFLSQGGGKEEQPEQKPWEQIKWNSPKPWPERLKGVELATTVPQSLIEEKPSLEQSIDIYGKGPVSTGGYTWPEGWEKAVEGVDSLTYFNYGGMPHDPAILLAQAVFERKTGIEIKAQAMEETGVWLKTVSAMMAKNSVPQLMHNFPTISLMHMVRAGWAMPLDWFWPKDVRDLYSEAMVGSARTPVEIRGHKYWASGQVSVKPFVLFYRPSILKEVGYNEPPQSYKELKTMAAKIAEETEKYGLALPGKDYRYMWYMMSGPLYGMEGKFIDEQGKFNVDSEKFAKTFKYMANLVRDGAAPSESLGWSWTNAPEVFARGRAAFLLAGPVNAKRWSKGAPDAIKGDWKARSPLPWKKGGKSYSAVGASPNWTVNQFASGQEKAAALLFLDLFRSYQSQWNSLCYEGNETSVPAIYDMETAQEALEYPELHKKAIQSVSVSHMPINGDQMLKLLLEQWAKAAGGQVSIEKALQTLKTDISDLQ